MASPQRTRRAHQAARPLTMRTVFDLLIGFALFTGFSALFVDTAGLVSTSIHSDWARHAGVIGAVAADIIAISTGHAPAGQNAEAVNALMLVPASPRSSFLAGLSAPFAMAMLAAVFSALVAFNLAFFRHLARQATCRHPALR